MESIIASVEAVVREQMGEDVTGHDWWHVERVRTMALRICDEEARLASTNERKSTRRSVNRTVVELAALMHDLEDHKFGGNDERIPQTVQTILEPLGANQQLIDNVSEAIRTVSFKSAAVDTTPKSKEGMIVQDADRLDAIGAIGIARCFATGAAIFKSPIFDPTNQTGTSIAHFHEKLLLLKDRLNTQAANRIAEHRHQYLIDFLAEFHAEWNGER